MNDQSGGASAVENLIARDEGKTLEFKENCNSLTPLARTVTAFANTAGGVVVIGVRDKTKEIVGVSDALREEERLANCFAHRIRPLLIPDIRISSWRGRELILINVPHLSGPFYVESEGIERGVYVRLGSTNRRADKELIDSLRRLSRNVTFDEEPCPEINPEDVDLKAASEFFSAVARPFSEATALSLGLSAPYGDGRVPTRGAVLLFGKTRRNVFPDAVVRCARFQGTEAVRFLDQGDIDEYLPRAVESVLAFVRRNTRMGAEIGPVRRRDVPEYPDPAVREAVVNALVHTDYSLAGMQLKVAVFDDRMEITNPGGLPFGMTMEAALSGVSKLRNRVIGRVFRELKLIEQWGTGIGRMIAACRDHGIAPPRFEEIGPSFRVTLFSAPFTEAKLPGWADPLIEKLAEIKRIGTKDAARLWGSSDRTARTRLRALVKRDVLAELATGPNDPKKVYVVGRAGRDLPQQR